MKALLILLLAAGLVQGQNVLLIGIDDLADVPDFERKLHRSPPEPRLKWLREPGR